MLAIVKYTDFAIENINVLLGKFGAEPFGLMNLGLPLGISFFTFQSVSYIIDVYRESMSVRRIYLRWDFCVILSTTVTGTYRKI